MKIVEADNRIKPLERGRARHVRNDGYDNQGCDTERGTWLEPERIRSRLLRLACGTGGMPWCNGRFRLAVRLHFHGFRETTGRGIRVESRIRLARLRNCRHDRGIILSVDWPFDRSGRASTDHSSVHDGVWLRCRFAGSLAPWIVAVLFDLLCDRRRWEWSSSSRLREVHFHLVWPTFEDGVRFRHGWSRFGGHDSAGCRAIYCQPVRMASRIRFARRARFAAGPAAQLALYCRTWSSTERVCSCCPFRADLAAGHTLIPFLDYCRGPLREFNQHERCYHSPVRAADRPRNFTLACCFMRFDTRRFKRARPHRNRLA